MSRYCVIIGVEAALALAATFFSEAGAANAFGVSVDIFAVSAPPENITALRAFEPARENRCKSMS